MFLRTRVALLVSIVLVIAVGAVVVLGLQRENLAARPYTTIAITGQDALWREILASQTVDLTGTVSAIAGDERLQTALLGGDLPRVRSLLFNFASLDPTAGDQTELQIIDRQGRVVATSSLVPEPPRLLDISTVEAVLDGQRPAGIRQVGADQFRVLAASVLTVPSGDRWVIIAAAPTTRPLIRFSTAMDGEAFMLSTRGRLIDGTNIDLWHRLALELPQRTATVTQAELNDRLFAVTAVPLTDLSAGFAGLLVVVQDATASLSAVRMLTRLGLVMAACVLLFTLAGFYLYLRRSFAPLEQAVDVLDALGRGDTSVRLSGGGNDEIGRIARAVAELRRSLVTLDQTRRQRELQRRRQERFVRRQMEELAGTLEPGAREEVLGDLGRIVAATSTTGNNAGQSTDPIAQLIRHDDQLGPLAAVLQQMSGRVVEQHRRLSELVARLREALVRETQLATLQQELAIAHDLQQSVIPDDFPDRPHFSISGFMESAREVGGDFYDFFERADGKLVFVIADVSGKGIPAAFFMAISRTLLKAIALFENDPGVCVRQLNELLAADNDQMMFVTLFFGVLDPETGHLDYVNAGHGPPVRVGANGAISMLPITDDMAVAIMESVPFTTRSVDLAPGDTLVLYTDGVTEAFNVAGEQYGEHRLLDILAQVPTESEAGALSSAVAEDVATFEAGCDRSDDITLVVLRYKGEPAPAGLPQRTAHAL
ncbi:Sigma-B regulation protein RsbU (Phosphoserine phosphatase) [Hyphomicrobiales bacterium]|nr:Sigma-B regulation protein RsbU (Phosphoserine phosphatase) [Hyphomicrobiales bacterium]CAH1689222.1 Sigma-B regulation protein RsbU (Phosphoserine phosphatase) [Hyphomicrobiales bacterium]